MKNIIFIAPPAAGKGTQSTKICTEYNIPHISTGDLLRDEIQKQTKIGLQIKDAMTRGELVSDEIITKLLRKRLSDKECKKGFILDGYPRNLSQGKLYEELLEELNLPLGNVIFLNIDKDTALERTLNRMVCSNCGASYNTKVEGLIPQKENICDICGHKLKTRSDDTEETFLKRFEAYLKETYSLIKYYEDKNVLTKIEVGNKTADEIFEEIKKALNG